MSKPHQAGARSAVMQQARFPCRPLLCSNSPQHEQVGAERASRRKPDVQEVDLKIHRVSTVNLAFSQGTSNIPAKLLS